MLSDQDIQTLKSFCEKYPTWWYKIGVCSRSRDFDCAPQGNSPEIEKGIWPDDCFTCDHDGSVSDAILDVMAQIEEAVPE